MRSLGLLTFMVPVGFSKAAGYYIGKFIGQGSEPLITHYYNVSMTMSVLVGALQIIILLLLQNVIINFYTDIREVQY